jgi:hypothetical protein
MTRSVNEVRPVSVPSLTVIVTAAVPLCAAAGAIVTVRDARDPPNVTLPAGKSTAFVELEVDDTVSAPADGSTSLTTNGTPAADHLRPQPDSAWP